MRILHETEETVVAIQRRVALIGSGMGPWISTKGLMSPRAKITGMKNGGKICIAMTDADDPRVEHSITQTMDDNGVFDLVPAKWMRVWCNDGGRNVICDILTQKAVA